MRADRGGSGAKTAAAPHGRSTRALEHGLKLALLVGLGICIALFSAYLSIVATFALARDDTLSSAGRVARIVLAWFLPLVAPLIMLRSIAEVSAGSLPPLAPIKPTVWLLNVRARRVNDLAADDDSPGSWPGGEHGQT